MNESDELIVRAAKWYFIFRFLWACIVWIIGMIIGIGAIIYWLCSKLLLELSYRRKYNTDWKVQYDNVYGSGSLSHAHVQIAVCGACLLALMAVLTWFCWQTFHRHKHRWNGNAS
jgi:hypothetical protein